MYNIYFFINLTWRHTFLQIPFSSHNNYTFALSFEIEGINPQTLFFTFQIFFFDYLGFIAIPYETSLQFHTNFSICISIFA